MVELIRISEASGAVLGLWNRKLSADPTTCYLMTYSEGKCSANCSFCPQARSSTSDYNRLSRVSWPSYSLESFLEALSESPKQFERICIQALNYPDVVESLCEIAESVKEVSDLPLSVSCQPLDRQNMLDLRKSGVDRLGVPIDGATPSIFDSVKGKSAGGPYSWDESLRALDDALEVFEGRATTHLIVGLGETDEEILRAIGHFDEKGIKVALFAFTPIKGSELEDKEKPSVEQYRRVQLAKYLIEEEIADFSDMDFDDGRLIDFGTSLDNLKETTLTGQPFLTSGCPGCNRPYYNETPLGPVYNFPKEPISEDLDKILGSLGSFF